MNPVNCLIAWAAVLLVTTLLWRGLVTGRLLRLYLLLCALPGIIFDVFHQIYLSIVDPIPTPVMEDKQEVIELDEYERGFL